MGVFDRLTGRREPPEATARRTDHELRRALLSLNAPDVPWVIREGSAKGADLVAEWRMVEPAWHGVFARAQLSRTFTILMRLDGSRREVRTVDEQREIEWVDGTPTFPISGTYQRGSIRAFSTQRTVERGSDGRWMMPVTSHFATEDLKEPVRSTVLESGWTWRPISFGKL